MSKIIKYLENTKYGHYKFYRMSQLNDKTWLAEWGKIGTNGQSKKYQMLEWHTKYQEKINKGYVEISSIDLSSMKCVEVLLNENYLGKILKILNTIDAVVKMQLDSFYIMNPHTPLYMAQQTIEEIYERYKTIGILYRNDMLTLNSLYTGLVASLNFEINNDERCPDPIRQKLKNILLSMKTININ